MYENKYPNYVFEQIFQFESWNMLYNRYNFIPEIEIIDIDIPDIERIVKDSII